MVDMLGAGVTDTFEKDLNMQAHTKELWHCWSKLGGTI